MIVCKLGSCFSVISLRFAIKEGFRPPLFWLRLEVVHLLLLEVVVVVLLVGLLMLVKKVHQRCYVQQCGDLAYYTGRFQ